MIELITDKCCENCPFFEAVTFRWTDHIVQCKYYEICMTVKDFYVGKEKDKEMHNDKR